MIPFYAVAKLKPMLGYDDTLDAFGIHGIGGTLGAILTGVFADPAINAAGKGLLYGNPGQLWTQIVAVGVTLVYSGDHDLHHLHGHQGRLSGSGSMRKKRSVGLDESQHGERAYNSISEVGDWSSELGAKS